jgi:hypothetical protein
MTTQGSAESSLACPGTSYCAVYLPETALTVPCDTGRINAVIAEQRGSLTTEESIRIPLKALGDHSLSVRTTALQDIRNILHHHRAWLGGLLLPNTTADGAAATGQQTELLSNLLGALLKCCDPEVWCHALSSFCLLLHITTADGAAAIGQQTVLLSSLLGALLKCCDPEVGVMLSHPFAFGCTSALQTVLLPQASKQCCILAFACYTAEVLCNPSSLPDCKLLPSKSAAFLACLLHC